MIVDKYGNYVRKFMWQLCEWDIVDICMTSHKNIKGKTSMKKRIEKEQRKKELVSQ
jgi:hypothetical protein